MVGKHWQSPRETPGAKPATLHQTSSVFMAYDSGKPGLFGAMLLCSAIVQLRTAFHCSLDNKQCQLAKTTCLKAAWQESTFTMHPSSPCATSFWAHTCISKICTLLSLQKQKLQFSKDQLHQIGLQEEKNPKNQGTQKPTFIVKVSKIMRFDNKSFVLMVTCN